MNSAIALKVLDIVLLGLSLAPEAARAAENLAESLQQLDGEDPTQEQWDQINRETDQLLADLRMRAKAARSA